MWLFSGSWSFGWGSVILLMAMALVLGFGSPWLSFFWSAIGVRGLSFNSDVLCLVVRSFRLGLCLVFGRVGFSYLDGCFIFLA